MTMERHHVQLRESKLWVPRVESKNQAIVVYSEFAMNLGCAEDLARLSLVARANFEAPVLKQFFNDDLEDRLTRRNYFEGSIGELAHRATTKSLVAAGMIVPDIDEGTVSGHVVEPFVGKEILPELYHIYQQNRRGIEIL